MSDSSKYVWVPDEKHLFRRGQIISEHNGVLKVHVDGHNDVIEIEQSKTEKVNPQQFDEAGDMAELTYLNEPSVVNNLHQRWQNGKIYTYSGLFLVAVNPYKEISQMYDASKMASFKNKRRDESEPHIFAIAEQAIHNLRTQKKDQSILITGESGAGKTENTKKAIQYLSSIANCTASKIDDKIIQTNPILEAFGNAQTIRNANSSRFGKFIKIHFDANFDTIIGASIQWYLLEKSRVLVQHKNERNYHIFYQLLKGAPDNLKEKLLLPIDAKPKDFVYLANGNDVIPNVNDQEQYSKLVEAFTIMGFTESEIFMIMQVVASILLLGEVKYKRSSADQGSVENMSAVEKCCELLGVDSTEFVNAVLNPKIKTGKQFVKQTRSSEQALHTTNAIAKALYERLFDYIVNQLNLRLGEQDLNTANIGVLDIAGFEIFEQNSFEQLCINYTNEKLQQFFNHHMFVLEQEEYIKQKVEWEYVDYGADLQPTIDLIEQSTNPMGIFSCLNEESALMSGSDASFNSKLVDQWGSKNPKFEPSRLGQGFKIYHYAQAVQYDTDGWMEKNKDPLSDSAQQMLASSQNTLISSMFAGQPTNNTPTSTNLVATKQKSMLFRTVAQKHKEQLNSLMTHLEATHPHFVRCILPNTQKSPNIFDNKLVLDQLRYNGVLEGIRIARAGFPNRIEFKEFCQRYRALADQVNGPLDSQHACASILQSIKLDPKSYKVGLSKVFFRNGVLAELEHKLDNLTKQQVLLVQSLARGAMVREKVNQALHRKRAAKMIAKCFKVSIKNAGDPWWTITTALKPLLVSKEGMDNSRKDLRMQKLESAINRLREEQVELVSSRNELRGELIAALRSKEELLKDIDTLKQEQSAINEEHEFAVTAARSRDEASTAALTQLSQKHAKLKDELDSLTSLKQKLQSEFEEKLEAEATKTRERAAQITEQQDKFKTTQKQLEDANNELANNKRELDGLKNALEQSKIETKRALDEVTKLKEQIKAQGSEISLLQKNVEDLKSLNQSLQTDIEKLQSDKQLSAQEFEDLQTALNQKNLKLTTLEDTHQKLLESHANNQKDFTQTRSLLEEKEKSLEANNKEVQKLKEWLKKAKSEIKNAVLTSKELSTLKETHLTTSKSLETAQSELDTTKAQLSELEDKLKSAPKLADVEKLEIQFKDATSELNKAKDQLDEANLRANKLQTELDAANAEIEQGKLNLDNSQAQLEKSRSEHMATSAELALLVKDHKKVNKDMEQLKTKFDDINLQLKESKAKETDLTKNLSRSVRTEQFDTVKTDLDKAKLEVDKLNKQLSLSVKREELEDTKAQLDNSISEVSKLKDQLAKSVSAEKLGKVQTELASANAALSKLKDVNSKSVSKTELTAASDRIKRLETDIDLTNENLLKLNDELVASQQKSEMWQKKYEELKSAPSFEQKYKDAESAKVKAIGEVEAMKRTVSEARAAQQSTMKELESLKLSSQTQSSRLKELMSKHSILEKETTNNQRDVFQKQSDIDRLEKQIASFNAKHQAALQAKDQEINTLSNEVLDLKDELKNAKALGDTEQELIESNHAVAELRAIITNLKHDLADARDENARHALLAQKYEKAMYEKKSLVQEISQLKLERSFKNRDADISMAQDSQTKRLQSEVKVLSIELARREKAMKNAESISSADNRANEQLEAMRKHIRLVELKNVNLEKQLKKANAIRIDTPELTNNESQFNYPKPRSSQFKDITNDRRVSSNGLHSPPSKLNNESREAEVYRERASEYMYKLERAEQEIDDAVRGERHAKKQLEDLKLRLSNTNEEHSAELQKLKSEIGRRDGLIKDLKNKAALAAQLDRELNASSLKIKELKNERTRLSNEKSRLEVRLRDLLSSNDGVLQRKDDQIQALKQNETLMLREQSDLRWKLERKERVVDQLRGSLQDAETRSDQYRDEIDRLKFHDQEKDVLIRRLNRQLNESKNKYLAAERSFEMSSKSPMSSKTHTPVDYNEPAFI